MNTLKSAQRRKCALQKHPKYLNICISGFLGSRERFFLPLALFLFFYENFCGILDIDKQTILQDSLHKEVIVNSTNT